MSVATMIAKAGTTLTHQRPTRTSGRTGTTQSMATQVSGVACWVQPAKSGVIEHYGRRDLTVTSAVFVEQKLGCLDGDTLVISDGRTLVVHGEVDQAGLARVWRIDAEETP